jgi:VanZ family protein
LLKYNEFTFYVLPPILWAGAIFVASSIPSESFPDLPIFSYDKFIHFGIFLVFAFLTYRALIHQTGFPELARNPLLYTFLIAAAYGAFDEIHQFLVPGRSPDLFDFLADSLGGCVAILAVHFWMKFRRTPSGK